MAKSRGRTQRTSRTSSAAKAQQAETPDDVEAVDTESVDTEATEAQDAEDTVIETESDEAASEEPASEKAAPDKAAEKKTAGKKPSEKKPSTKGAATKRTSRSGNPAKRSQGRKTASYTSTSGQQTIKPNPSWFLPVLIGLLVIGLIWLVTFYITQGAFPVEAWGNWNILIGFAFFVAGLIMSTRWR